eukprot:TRINITY_DN542_c0_g2_i1.p1 TRINITY_DN542_c0_g2~~TRINITY_DN542_c0_g2_i1.p1  ORF type:complete len:472 (+),score=111.53 TRINITY_DN542_c0_g2_i1:129-1418(+)
MSSLPPPPPRPTKPPKAHRESRRSAESKQHADSHGTLQRVIDGEDEEEIILQPSTPRARADSESRTKEKTKRSHRTKKTVEGEEDEKTEELSSISASASAPHKDKDKEKSRSKSSSSSKSKSKTKSSKSEKSDELEESQVGQDDTSSSSKTKSSKTKSSKTKSSKSKSKDTHDHGLPEEKGSDLHPEATVTDSIRETVQTPTKKIPTDESKVESVQSGSIPVSKENTESQPTGSSSWHEYTSHGPNTNRQRGQSDGRPKGSQFKPSFQPESLLKYFTPQQSKSSEPKKNPFNLNAFQSKKDKHVDDPVASQKKRSSLSDLLSQSAPIRSFSTAIPKGASRLQRFNCGLYDGISNMHLSFDREMTKSTNHLLLSSESVTFCLQESKASVHTGIAEYKSLMRAMEETNSVLQLQYFERHEAPIRGTSISTL